MKKWLSMLMVLMMLFTLTACGGGGDAQQQEANNNDVVEKQQQEEQNVPNEEDVVEEMPAGIEVPYDKYPWLESLVLPDDAVVTSYDDQWYAEDGVITLIVKPMTADKVAAYEQKLKEAGYTDAEVSGVVSPDGKFEMAVGDTWVDIDGYIDLTIFDTSTGAN